MSLIIWRDSVAMGDDVDAPHEWVLAAAEDESIGAVVDLQKGAPLPDRYSR